jgi:hypothetical protein
MSYMRAKDAKFIWGRTMAEEVHHLVSMKIWTRLRLD